MGHFTRTVRIVEFLASKCKKDKFVIITNKYLIKKSLPKNIIILLLPNANIKDKPKNVRYVYHPEVVEKLSHWILFINKQLDKYKPSVFYSDLSPSGGYGELKYIFPVLKKRNIKTIIGLRDILDSPNRTRKEWIDNKIISIYEYDRILIYGHESYFKRTYSKILLPKNKINFPGYILPEKYPISKTKKIDILALFGGGGSSFEQIIYISKLLSKIKNKNIIIITGPLFPKKTHSLLQAQYKNIKFIKTANHTQQFISNSKLIISHCGYNTVLESLINSKKVIIFPRQIVRKEQIYRAKYFKEKGYCDYINSNNSDKTNLKKIEKAFLNERTKKLYLKNGLNNNLKKLFWLK